MSVLSSALPPPATSPTSECVFPLETKGWWGGGNTCLRVRGEGSQLGRLERKLGTLHTLWLFSFFSSDPYLWLTDPDADQGPDPEADPALFVSDLQEKKYFCAYSFFKVHLHHSSKTTSHKEVLKQHKSRFKKNFMLVDGWNRGSGIRSNKLPIRFRIQENQTHMDLTDADPDADASPEHCFTWG